MRWIAVASLVVAACGDGDAARQSVTDDRLIFAAQENVRARLSDPQSAQFLTARISRKAGVPAICDAVNSRNGFGGMTGPQRYIGGGAAVLEEEMEPREFAISWDQLCA